MNPLNWVRIDTNALTHNLHQLRRHAGSQTKMMVVVKSDGYGHGAVPSAQAALDGGAEELGVSTVAEGMALRLASITAPVFVMGMTTPDGARFAARYNLTPMLCELATVEAYAQAVSDLGGQAQCYLKVDTGMGRLGCEPEDAADMARAITGRGIELKGLMSHIPDSDAEDKSLARRQVADFRALIKELQSRGISLPTNHIANTAALIDIPEARLEMCRPGLGFYGHLPSPYVSTTLALKNAFTWQARLVYCRHMPTDRTVSYGRTYRLDAPTVVGVVPVGYSHGYMRRLGNQGMVLWRGRRCPVIGAVSMDMLMIDLGDDGLGAEGEIVTLLGRDGDEEITVAEMAGWLGTIPYEVLCLVDFKVPRLYD